LPVESDLPDQISSDQGQRRAGALLPRQCRASRLAETCQ
jgi:hypothetical protein